jgi:hypothetical protein
MRSFLAAAACCAFLFASGSAEARGPDLSREFTGDRYSGNAPAAAPQRYVVRKAKRNYRKAKRAIAKTARTIAGYAAHLAEHPTRDLTGFPAPLVAKVREIQSACGSKVTSAYRPGARVRGSGSMSLHASKRAVDMQGNASCIYAKLKGWPGGVSTDYRRVNHVHFSYAPNGKEWGARFAHYSGKRYAKKRVRYARAG